MAIPDAVKVAVEASLVSFIEQRIPAHARDKVRLSYGFRGNSVTIYEDRPAFLQRGDWSRLAIAQFRYDPERRTWTLYCADRNSRWHEYFDSEASEDLDALLQEAVSYTHLTLPTN